MDNRTATERRERLAHGIKIIRAHLGDPIKRLKKKVHSMLLFFVGSPLEIVNAGDHCDLRISKQMLPLLLIFG